MWEELAPLDAHWEGGLIVILEEILVRWEGKRKGGNIQVDAVIRSKVFETIY